MKKKAVILSALLFAGMFAACGEKNQSGSASTNETLNTQNTGTQESGTTSPDTAGDTDLEIAYLKDVAVEDYMSLNGEYVGLTLSIPPKEEVTDEQVERLALNAYNGNIGILGGIEDRAVEIGDTINLDYSGFKDGVAFAGGTAQNQQLIIGSGKFINGFEDGLVGVMPGETVDLNLSFPEGYGNAELAGQPVVFTVTVNYIYPDPIISAEEMQDEIIIAMTDGEFETADAFLEYCRDYLEYEAEYNYTIYRENAVIAALEGLFTFDGVPRALQNKYVGNIRTSLENTAMQNGIDIDTYCYYFYQVDAATYLELASQASAQQGMAFQYVANNENLTVSDEELEESLHRFAEENGVASVEELLLVTDRESFREYFLFEKVVDFIIQNGHVTEE
ncbi:MAG: FKBP-type peptidyl-prolyl cis-trans isomerase [Lachnospiraceae bacterium]|nr:FKBP-type peptidyl-prolyl cis-trans isomerase [Lachnospiraceae bacterium]